MKDYAALRAVFKSFLADAGVLSVALACLIWAYPAFGYTEMINMDIIEFGEFLVVAEKII